MTGSMTPTLDLGGFLIMKGMNVGSSMSCLTHQRSALIEMVEPLFRGCVQMGCIAPHQGQCLADVSANDLKQRLRLGKPHARHLHSDRLHDRSRHRLCKGGAAVKTLGPPMQHRCRYAVRTGPTAQKRHRADTRTLPENMSGTTQRNSPSRAKSSAQTPHQALPLLARKRTPLPLLTDADMIRTPKGSRVDLHLPTAGC